MGNGNDDQLGGRKIVHLDGPDYTVAMSQFLESNSGGDPESGKRMFVTGVTAENGDQADS